MATGLPRRGYSSTRTSSSNKSSVPPRAQSQNALLSPAFEMGGTHAPSTCDVRRPSTSSMQNDNCYGSSSKSGRMRREHVENVERILSSPPTTTTTTSQRRSHHVVSGLVDRAQPLYGLKTKDVLEHPRLQKMTGVFPGRVAKMVGNRELPPDELYRLVALLSIPDEPPAKRPLGDS